MTNALMMFNELGFKLYDSGEYFLLYKYETDYVKVLVYFDLQQKTYYTTWSRFIDNNKQAFVPMAQRPQNTKHSAKYGHWQAEMYHEINVKQHEAIHQQMLELGWIK